jgi:hypothetical protein
MFCPNCATQNGDDARFCRGCGVDISLVPQAVTGTLAERLAAAEDDTRDGRRRRRRGERPPTIERAVKGIFLGVAFFFIAFAARAWAPAGNVWWFWMFIPAALHLASGIGGFARLAAGEGKRRETPGRDPARTSTMPPRHASALPPRDTGEMIPPPSVTEATTRHLGVPVERERGE